MKPRLLFISHVNPVNPRSGQQQRVFYSLQAARNFFHVTFLTLASADVEQSISALEQLCDEVLVFPSVLSQYKNKAVHILPYLIFRWKTGLKTSNYVLGEVEFSRERLEKVLGDRYFDYVIYEYWYSYKSISFFHERDIPCALDMHDVLWKAFEQQVNVRKFPKFYKERVKRLYREHEELAWQSFDRIIAINQLEQKMIESVVSETTTVDFLPMGIDLDKWQYTWQYHAKPPSRIGFYGGLSSDANVKSALWCLDGIMPLIWQQKPDAEFWLIGNRPADVLLQRAQKDDRIKITGFIENIAEIIADMGVILCPWDGVFGFRSRIIEVMAVGTPLVVTEDAIAGMGIAAGATLVGEINTELANHVLELLDNMSLSKQISLIACRNVKVNYTYESSYFNYFWKLSEWVRK